MTQSETFVFHRHREAAALADALIRGGRDGRRPGLFLAGPRRSGKTTFLTADLVPLLADRGVASVHAALGADRAGDPGDRRLRLLGAGATAAQADAEIRLGPGGGADLAEALHGLSRAAGGPVALILDDAQAILSAPGAAAAMATLAEACDALAGHGGDGVPGLIPVFASTRRDCLAGLMQGRNDPFFGARITDMPRLGADYVTARVARLNSRLAADNRIEPRAACAAFDALGHRPDLLEDCLRETALGPGGAAALGASLAEDGRAIRDRLWAAYDAEFGDLSATQAAVAEQMIRQGEGFQPFVAGTLRAISARLGRDTGKSTVQSAIRELRAKGLVWQSGRGRYAFEDQGTIPWLRARGAAP